jgi:hypothetical protein
MEKAFAQMRALALHLGIEVPADDAESGEARARQGCRYWGWADAG